MSLPITIPILTIEIKQIVKADAQPTAPTGYEVVQLKDLTYTKLWLTFKVVE